MANLVDLPPGFQDSEEVITQTVITRTVASYEYNLDWRKGDEGAEFITNPDDPRWESIFSGNNRTGGDIHGYYRIDKVSYVKETGEVLKREQKHGWPYSWNRAREEMRRYLEDPEHKPYEMPEREKVRNAKKLALEEKDREIQTMARLMATHKMIVEDGPIKGAHQEGVEVKS